MVAPFARLRLNHWHSNEEIYKILAHCNHLLATLASSGGEQQWLCEHKVTQRPLNGSVFLFDRRRVKNFKKDSFMWKRRKTGGANSVREDRMCLKVNGSDCIYGCYAHSAIMSTFHRRCYWLLDKPDVVLVHYLQTPNSETGECLVNFNSNPITNSGADADQQQQSPANEQDLRTELRAMLWPFYMDAELSGDAPETFIERIAAKLLPKQVESSSSSTSSSLSSSSSSSSSSQHIRINLMAYMHLNTAEILAKLKIDDIENTNNHKNNPNTSANSSNSLNQAWV